jgi:hypothetical protein
LVKRTIGKIDGVGELAIYDTAHRLGAYCDLSPDHVYLHAGTRDGARFLGLAYRAAKLSKKVLPKEFQKLRAEQTEDCLCMFKSQLQRLNRPNSTLSHYPIPFTP